MQKKILVIDDNVPSAQTLMWAMQAMDYDVRVAFDGDSAMEKIDEFIPDIVLCDIMMPRFSGYEICRRMRADPRLEQTIFVAQTGLGSPESKKLTNSAGFNHHLVKPIDIEALHKLVA